MLPIKTLLVFLTRLTITFVLLDLHIIHMTSTSLKIQVLEHIELLWMNGLSVII